MPTVFLLYAVCVSLAVDLESTSSVSLIKNGSLPFPRLIPKEGTAMAKTMKLQLDGIAYTATLQENTVTDMLVLQGPIEPLLKRYAGQEYYAPLPNPLPISGMPTTTTVHAGGLYCYEGFGVLSIPFQDVPVHPYEAMHLGDINEDILSHLANAGNAISARL